MICERSSIRYALRSELTNTIRLHPVAELRVTLEVISPAQKPSEFGQQAVGQMGNSLLPKFNTPKKCVFPFLQQPVAQLRHPVSAIAKQPVSQLVTRRERATTWQ